MLSIRRMSFASHKLYLVRCKTHSYDECSDIFQVWWASSQSRVQFFLFWDNVDNEKYIWILLKNDCLNFVRYSGYNLGEVGKSISSWWKISQGFKYQKPLTLVNFWQSYSKIFFKNGAIFETWCMYRFATFYVGLYSSAVMPVSNSSFQRHSILKKNKFEIQCTYYSTEINTLSLDMLRCWGELRLNLLTHVNFQDVIIKY